MLKTELSNISDVLLSSTGSNLRKRLTSAARLGDGLADQVIALLGCENPEFDLWVAIINALGLDVRIGLDGLDYEENILFLVQAAEWRNNRSITGAIRERFPDAKLCILTGISRVDQSYSHDSCPSFDDARSVLQAAGIGFFSIAGDQCVAV
jgi:DNA-binding phage protein